MSAVLIADDDPIARELLVYRLEAEGFEVCTAEDGPTALAAAQEQAPDIAVLDVHMPGLSGFDVCRMLRTDPATSAIAVIMLTASVQESDVATGFDVGADDYLAKPFNPRELVSRIEAVLARTGR
ncbi:MAG TPA: response regulator [Actinocrinis sp.]|nr:response regulator [Actinocrinis sp.]